MARWHHRLNGREFEWTPGVGDGQGGLARCDSSDHKELDTTERLNWNELNWTERLSIFFLKSPLIFFLLKNYPLINETNIHTEIALKNSVVQIIHSGPNLYLWVEAAALISCTTLRPPTKSELWSSNLPTAFLQDQNSPVLPPVLLQDKLTMILFWYVWFWFDIFLKISLFQFCYMIIHLISLYHPFVVL